MDTKLLLGLVAKFKQASESMTDAELGEFVRVTLKMVDQVDEIDELIQMRDKSPGSPSTP